jgi:hypothetical protein
MSVGPPQEPAAQPPHPVGPPQESSSQPQLHPVGSPPEPAAQQWTHPVGPPQEPSAQPQQLSHPVGLPPEPGPQQWTYPAGPPSPPKGPWLGLAALLLGLLGVVVPLLPINLDMIRPYPATAGGLAGLVVGALGLLGNRRGKPLAAIGVLLSLLALLIGAIVLAGHLGLF